jgi:hypothetical protein
VRETAGNWALRWGWLQCVGTARAGGRCEVVDELGDAGGAGVRLVFVVVQICRQDSRQEALLWCGSAVVMRRGRKQS